MSKLNLKYMFFFFFLNLHCRLCFCGFLEREEGWGERELNIRVTERHGSAAFFAHCKQESHLQSVGGWGLRPRTGATWSGPHVLSHALTVLSKCAEHPYHQLLNSAGDTLLACISFPSSSGGSSCSLIWGLFL